MRPSAAPPRTWTCPTRSARAPVRAAARRTADPEPDNFPMLDGNPSSSSRTTATRCDGWREDIDRATDYVNLVFYIAALDPEGREGYANVVLDALERAKAAG